MLAYYCSGWFVVDVEVTCGVAEDFYCFLSCFAVIGEDGSGECVFRGAVAGVEDLFVFGVFVDEEGEDRAEDFFAE